MCIARLGCINRVTASSEKDLVHASQTHYLELVIANVNHCSASLPSRHVNYGLPLYYVRSNM
jgi:hypothetical protein